ncbi:Glycylpeptide N-tetradecanoyltransferase [Mycena venus]|uniref:Glycylpeptide N-tetradecanoyltransferase n=1 Tax=Mycena venus TaxID=2733690 RepID=A0A8H6X256_9AGAR|nr:Glycylpeptide N-tetradecanoyltransferase [Mycena venus]
MSGIQNYKNATDITDQGIVDGRPAGQQPQAVPASATIGTYVDKNAGNDNERMDAGYNQLPGATSKDVYESAGQPGSGMSSKEVRHDGQPGRKREKLGSEQYGTSSKDVEA